MTCNIDRRGRRFRRIMGQVAVAAAVLPGSLAMLTGGVALGVVAIALAAGGAFSLYEARRGWCAVRAAGFRTPI